MIRTLLCDMGNVLIHVDEVKKVASTAALLDLTAEETAAIFQNDQLQWRYEAGQIGTDAFLAAVHDAGRKPASPSELLRAFSDIFRPVAGMDELLAALARRGVRLVLVSNTNPAHIAQVRRVFPGLARFDAAVLSYEVRAMKPDPLYYRHAAELAGCRVDQALFVDDLEANIEGAQAAGFRTHTFTDAARLGRMLKAHGLDVNEP